MATCVCGRAHAVGSAVQAYLDVIVTQLGTTVSITTAAGTWHVPRAYVAVHGLDDATLPQLAADYHWRRAS